MNIDEWNQMKQNLDGMFSLQKELCKLLFKNTKSFNDIKIHFPIEQMLYLEITNLVKYNYKGHITFNFNDNKLVCNLTSSCVKHIYRHHYFNNIVQDNNFDKLIEILEQEHSDKFNKYILSRN
jgi:hypothetical protein